jgi:hypothetical protein
VWPVRRARDLVGARGARLSGRGEHPALEGAGALAAEGVSGSPDLRDRGLHGVSPYDGSGGSNLGAPDLSKEGAKGRGLQFQINHLKCPSCVNPGSPMPPFASLGDENIRKIAIFLEASKGGK